MPQYVVIFLNARSEVLSSTALAAKDDGVAIDLAMASCLNEPGCKEYVLWHDGRKIAGYVKPPSRNVDGAADRAP